MSARPHRTAMAVPEGGPIPPPPPARVRYNDWRAVRWPAPGAFAPERPVSVIVPTYQAPAALALTLAGLERQDWPRELLEVVVVDDGSDPPVERPLGSAPEVRVVRQPRRGFGLARARNTGVRAASHDILVFLDGDVIAEAGLIAAHARHHHAVADALTLGFCAYVDADGISACTVRDRRGTVAELFAGRRFDPPWLERHMARTDDLTSRHTDLFRAVTGHNFGISRALFEEAGGFDESFERYGGEDTEFAYRVQLRGGLLAPAPDAFAWHQGRWLDGRNGKERERALQADKLADLVAEPGLRPAGSARRYTVPRYAVTLAAGEAPVERVVGSADALLAGGDLAVRIGVPAHRDAERARLRRRYARDARVRVDAGGSALDAFPASPLHVRVPAGARVGPGALTRLEAALGDAVTASVNLGGGAKVTIARAWALARARRAGGTASAYGDSRVLPARTLRSAGDLRRAPALRPAKPTRATGGMSSAAGAPSAGGEPLPARGLRPAVGLRPAGRVLARVWAEARQVRDVRTGWHFLRWLLAGLRWRLRQGCGWSPPAGSVLARVWAEARHVRGVRTGWRFLRWLLAGLRWRLRQGRGWSPPEAAGSAAPASPDPPLGAAIAALGPRARAVFAASDRVRQAPDSAPLDAVLADTAEAAAGVTAARALLSESPALAAPAFDPALHNPVGWVRHVENRAVSLGPPRRLPRGSPARRAVVPSDRAALAHAHHLEDTAAFHADATRRAGALARIAALGLPVRLADADSALAPLLGEPLHRLMRVDCRGAGAAEREALGIAQRREALRTHSLAARVRQVCEAAGAPPPARPQVSVLLATRRPALLVHAVGNVARQTYPRLELVLALHGPGFAPGAVEAALARFPHPVRILRFDRNLALGAVLAAAAAAASGALLAKMDDDDAYGPEHLWDLALAHEYSGAALVGKFPATVYLAHADCTVRAREVPPETWSGSVTGGAMLIGRADLERAGGWRPLPRHVDRALVEDVLRSGGAVYRTHDAGYVLVRHGLDHTWRRADRAFLAAAESVHRGWRPELAGLDGPRPPLPPRDAGGPAE